MRSRQITAKEGGHQPEMRNYLAYEAPIEPTEYLQYKRALAGDGTLAWTYGPHATRSNQQGFSDGMSVANLAKSWVQPLPLYLRSVQPDSNCLQTSDSYFSIVSILLVSSWSR